jgi:hypothetical protein
VVHSSALDAFWPEMTGRKTQRMATDEPDMLSRCFRLTGCGQRVPTARQRDGVFLKPAARLSPRLETSECLIGRSPIRLWRSTPRRASGNSLLRAVGGLGGGPHVNLRRNHRPSGPLRLNLIAPIGEP